ncbi:type VI secretion system protein TssA [Pseudomonas sp. ZM23]|uniref:Type VI secretion system protein TssA n=1 Tax=Pseudomonas triclosanedens TaxID=2961893 RepID=A0ABY6ZUJ7_9PSED|nr:type VI secretion system protein TssA [Pseudomonas triclosanedens]MCP8467015.1 type VI secretion system protein TssA [Pseudomonas triclosanedens]MCP8472837.1 type VI secretion system protein TssA [Pseudomonas triclosanedens]MCP8478268.1 type VI secretion system protein TssA [Pseudomonas triclosanedens]WAI47673.1 type VI secretion system protein TssA [Pseudomonas triclosanedens]
MITDDALRALLSPFPGQDICGESLRHDPVLDRLRELRREDDQTLPTGVWQAEPKRADWHAVAALAEELLVTRSKDLMVAAYLGEAWIMLRGIAGLADALGLLADLCEAFPECLHPQAPDGDLAWRAAPLVWLARRYEELVNTRIPLCPNWPEMSLHAWQELKRNQVLASDSKADKASAEAARLQQKKLDEAIRSGSVGGWGVALALLATASGHLDRLDAWSDQQLMDEAPSLQGLASCIRSLANVIQGCRNMAPQEQEAAEIVPAASVSEDLAAPALAPIPERAGAVPDGLPRDREDAYRQLAAIADYLARTEPHSPVPYIVRRAVEWGRMPLSALLDELVNADAEARRVWVMLGVLR